MFPGSQTLNILIANKAKLVRQRETDRSLEIFLVLFYLKNENLISAHNFNFGALLRFHKKKKKKWSDNGSLWRGCASPLSDLWARVRGPEGKPMCPDHTSSTNITFVISFCLFNHYICL
jgi:hypothetical protein